MSTQPYAVTQLVEAQTQAALATTGLYGTGLDKLEDAQGYNDFMLPPIDNGGALRHAAYWTALAGRLLGDRSLGISAASYAAQATGYPIALLDSSSVVSTLTQARSGILAALTKAQQAQSADTEWASRAAHVQQVVRIVGVLSQYATPSILEKTQDEDDSLVGYLRKLKHYSETLAKVVTFAAIGLSATAIAAAVWFGVRWWKNRKHTRRNGLSGPGLGMVAWNTLSGMAEGAATQAGSHAATYAIAKARAYARKNRRVS